MFQVFGDEANMYPLEDVQLQDLGQVAEVTITKDDCLMMKVREGTDRKEHWCKFSVLNLFSIYEQ